MGQLARVLGGTAALHSHSTVGGCIFLPFFTLMRFDLPPIAADRAQSPLFLPLFAGDGLAGGAERDCLAEFRFMPAACPAAPRAQALAQEESGPCHRPNTGGEKGQQEVPPIRERGMHEHFLAPAMGAVCRKPGAPRRGSVVIFHTPRWPSCHGVHRYRTRRAASIRT